MTILSFALGMFCGTAFGLTVAAILASGRSADDLEIIAASHSAERQAAELLAWSANNQTKKAAP